MESSTQQEWSTQGIVPTADTGGETPALPTSAELAEGLDALSRATRILKKARTLVEAPVPARVGKLAGDLAGCDLDRIAALAGELVAWVEHERSTRGARLRADLRAACAERDIPVGVLSRDPLELYLPPITVRVDVDADRADLSFARIRLARCRADGVAVAAARDEAVAGLEGDSWDPNRYLGQLRDAWARAGRGDWVELVDVLPELALLRQPAAFRKNPVARQFQPYPRVQFAYDLWRLRRDRCLAADGWRLTLGSATGGSTRDKSRVLWLEDGRGGGQYHLTLRFVRERNDD